MHEITADEMAKAKVGFALHFINRNLVMDVMASDELADHNQASLEWFLVTQEKADERLGKFGLCGSPPSTVHSHILANDSSGIGGSANPVVNVKPFLKVEEGNPFYVLPVVGEPLFPQFKGPRTPGVIRAKRQRGMPFIKLSM